MQSQVQPSCFPLVQKVCKCLMIFMMYVSLYVSPMIINISFLFGKSLCSLLQEPPNVADNDLTEMKAETSLEEEYIFFVKEHSIFHIKQSRNVCNSYDT